MSEGDRERVKPSSFSIALVIFNVASVYLRPNSEVSPPPPSRFLTTKSSVYYWSVTAGRTASWLVFPQTMIIFASQAKLMRLVSKQNVEIVRPIVC